ncbi:MAG: peptidoglycan DD-metalloendopeptidase family protein [Pirellulaceae bacterium]|nr:peptidoglycan DD-metalloendopeptidase family protein [Pirellulaceae bacterium]
MLITSLPASKRLVAVCLMVAAAVVSRPVVGESPEKTPLVRTVDLDVGETASVELCDGSTVEVKLASVVEHRDPVRNALRRAMVTVEIDGESVVLESSNYQLPKTVGRVQIDCPVTKGYLARANKDNPWSLDRDARLRLWPKGSPWIRPGTFGYPLDQRWFAGYTQMCNQISDGERVESKTIYYHWGLDFGGAEGMVDVLAATDGTVVSAAGKFFGKKSDYPPTVQPRYDVVYLRDDRGWYYRYSHLFSIDPAVKLGARVAMGQKIGVLGKEGASGGWSHLHFDVSRPMPSGRYGIDDAYAFAWQAYQQEHPTPLVAVARPHWLARVGDPVVLDASKSYSAAGGDSLKYEWTLSDGTKAAGSTVERTYDQPGWYCETVKVVDAEGRMDYDFAKVMVVSRDNPRKRPPNVHAAYWPTRGIKPGDAVTFKVITREIEPGDGHEVWDFGDGSPTVTTQSVPKPYAYAATTHVFDKPGGYLVTVHRENSRGERGTDRLYVRVEE